MMALDEKIRIIKVITLHPEGDKNVCAKFYVNPCNIVIWNKIVGRPPDIDIPKSTLLAWLKMNTYFVVFLKNL